MHYLNSMSSKSIATNDLPKQVASEGDRAECGASCHDQRARVNTVTIKISMSHDTRKLLITHANTKKDEIYEINNSDGTIFKFQNNDLK